jgi:hypothetical protein
MKLTSWKWFLSIGFVALLSGGTAHAQFFPGQGYPNTIRPAVTPYLNLLRGNTGGSLTLNYFGLVQPQQQFYGATAQLQQQFAGVQQQLNADQTQLPPGTLPPTGHRFGFMTQSTYFMTLRRGGGRGGGGIGGLNALAGPGLFPGGLRGGGRPVGGTVGVGGVGGIQGLNPR